MTNLSGSSYGLAGLQKNHDLKKKSKKSDLFDLNQIFFI